MVIQIIIVIRNGIGTICSNIDGFIHFKFRTISNARILSFGSNDLVDWRSCKWSRPRDLIQFKLLIRTDKMIFVSTWAPLIVLKIIFVVCPCLRCRHLTHQAARAIRCSRHSSDSRDFVRLFAIYFRIRRQWAFYWTNRQFGLAHDLLSS